MSGGLGGGDSPSHGTWSQCCHPPASETLRFGHQGRKPLALSLFFHSWFLSSPVLLSSVLPILGVTYPECSSMYPTVH